jgi:hypothetical protein
MSYGVIAKRGLASVGHSAIEYPHLLKLATTNCSRVDMGAGALSKLPDGGADLETVKGLNEGAKFDLGGEGKLEIKFNVFAQVTAELGLLEGPLMFH